MGVDNTSPMGPQMVVQNMAAMISDSVDMPVLVP